MGLFDWVNRKPAAESSAPGDSTANGRDPAREDPIHEALVELSVVVNAMGRSDPAHPSWPKYMGDFNEAVKHVRQAVRSFDPELEHETTAIAPPARNFSRNGNAIRIESSGQWIPHDSMCESRAHIGTSIEGVHGGLEVSLGKGAIAWGEARASQAEARRDAAKMREDWSEFPPFESFHTKHNNFIDPIWADGWRGQPEFVSNERIGRSDEGFHGGVSTSWRNADVETHWGPARETIGRARDDAGAMRLWLAKDRDVDREVERVPASREDGFDR